MYYHWLLASMFHWRWSQLPGVFYMKQYLQRKRKQKYKENGKLKSIEYIDRDEINDY